MSWLGTTALAGSPSSSWQTTQFSYSTRIPDVPDSNFAYFTVYPHSDSRSVYGLKPNAYYMHHTLSN